jgi:hypothetical protein
MNWTVPTIAGIQRATAILTLICTALMLFLVSAHAAISSAIGGVLMIANLYLLVVIGKAIVGLAAGSGGAVAGLGAVIAPLKLLVFMLVVYLVITWMRVDSLGFMLGVLTQFAAIFIETVRVAIRTPTADRTDMLGSEEG